MPDEIPYLMAVGAREISSRRGLDMAAVSGTYNMAHPDPAVRADGLRKLRELIAAAPALGTACVTLCTGSRDAEDMWRRHRDNATPEAWSDMRESVEAAVAVAESHGVTLGFEPEHNNVVNDATAGRRLISELGSSNLKVVIDPANLFPAIAAEAPAAAESLRGQFARPFARERASVLQRMPADHPLSGGLRWTDVSTPTLVLATHRDPIHPFAIAEAIASRLPVAELREVPSKDVDPPAHARAIAEAVSAFAATVR